MIIIVWWITDSKLETSVTGIELIPVSTKTGFGYHRAINSPQSAWLAMVRPRWVCFWEKLCLIFILVVIIKSLDVVGLPWRPWGGEVAMHQKENLTLSDILGSGILPIWSGLLFRTWHWIVADQSADTKDKIMSQFPHQLSVQVWWPLQFQARCPARETDT